MSLEVREAPAELPIAASEKALLPWITWFSQVQDILSALTLSGPTESRPTKFLWRGRPYLDDTVDLPIWLAQIDANPALNVWKDYQGNVV